MTDELERLMEGKGRWRDKERAGMKMLAEREAASEAIFARAEEIRRQFQMIADTLERNRQRFGLTG
jgi:hypothetical protein